MFDLRGKVAIVTGGSRGIGQASAVGLADAGARVVVGYRSHEEGAKDTVREIENHGGEAEIVQLDVVDAEIVDTVIGDIHERLGRIDILVNNAGQASDQLLLRVTDEDIDAIFATNVKGTIHCTKACLRPMMRAKTGRIINLSSVVAEAGNPGQAVYSASKAALIGLTKTLAREYASRKITVNAVAPGYIETDMTSGLSEELQKKIVEQTPLGRVGTPQEVAAAVVFLASDEAAYVTGQVVRVNGGMYV